MNQSNEMKTYCRVLAGKVTEYPVSLSTIERRGHPVSWYRPTVLIEVKPEGRNDVQYTEYTVGDSVVTVTRKYRSFTAEEVFVLFKQPDGSVKQIEEINPEDMSFACRLITDYFESKIDALGKARGYDSINNVLSRYMNSSIQTYKAEAEFIQRAIDTTWAQLEQYMMDLQTKQLPLPANMAQVEAAVRVPNWGE